jgi:two-component system, OmpR family, response regulator
MGKINLINIFIVEDNEIFKQALKGDIQTAFPLKKIKIHPFETGEACMLKFNEIKPDIVILDYNLNSKISDAADGIKILDRIKKINPETNVIMLTSQDNIEIALKSFKHGAFDYVVKNETKFSKINNSLLNAFKVMDAKIEAILFKRLTVGFGSCIAILIIGVIVLHTFFPSLLRLN